jgi:hypothetical protein
MVELGKRKKRPDFDLAEVFDTKRVKKGEECPFVGQVKRHLVDFDL